MSLGLLSLLLNLVIVLLLVITIYYCTRLNTRIRVLQDSKSQLAKLIRQFDEATERATISISELQSVSKKVNEGIQTRLDKANFLADDLSFMIERGNKLAGNMEAGIAANRRTGSGAEAAFPAAKPSAGSPAPRSPSLPGAQSTAKFQEQPQSRASSPLAGNSSSSAVSSLESMVDRMSGARGNTSPAAPKPASGARPRSKAEQELLDAIKAGR